MQPAETTSITIAGDIKVTVPTSPRYLTTFVLNEQHDWFEDEIHFLRTYIKPDMNMIDIGANYGLYTLTAAKIIGDTGKIWAFEPTTFTSDCLRQSITNNHFNNINLIQSGLSNQLGEAKLYVSPNSELNTLLKEATPSTEYENISLLTLDHCWKEYNWDDIDFVKLDAEGEEANILKAGSKMLDVLSPLIMFELKHGNQVNLELIDQFITNGYRIYRLVPGLNCLIPFDHQQPFDGFLLNLFCCKDDRAESLQKDGVLVKKINPNNPDNLSEARDYIKSLPYSDSHIVENLLNEKIGNEEYSNILNLYITSLDETQNMHYRVDCLFSALNSAKIMIGKGENRIEKLASLSRIAFDAGERALGIEILSGLINQYANNLDFDIRELFLPASPDYDHVNPGNNLKEWFFSSILEQCIRKHAFSSYFTQGKALPLYQLMSQLGFMSAEMKTRQNLVSDCYR